MVEKQWYFDPAKPAEVPECLHGALESRGIPLSEIRLCLMTDLSPDMVRCDCWLLATDTHILILCGSMKLVSQSHRRKGFTPERSFAEISYTTYDLKEFAEFFVEEQIASIRLTAKRKEEPTYQLLLNGSNTYRPSCQAAAKFLKQLVDKGEIEPDKEGNKRDEIFCPKCGTRYVDAARKICPKCMDKNKILRRMGTFLIRYRVNMLLIVLALILSSAMGVLTPYISSGFYFDEVLNVTGKFYGQLLLVLGLIVGTRILSMFISMFHTIVTSTVAAKLSYDLKKTIFNAIERLSISFYTNRQTGGLMAQVTNDADTIYWFFCDGVPYFLVNIVQIAVMLIIMLIINPVLTLLALVTVPLVVFSIRTLFNKMEKLHAKRWAKSRGMNAVLSDVLSGMRVVKAFSKEKDEITRFRKSSHAVAEAEQNTSVFASLAFPGVNMLFSISNLIVLGAGGWMVIQGKMTYGILLTFISYMNMIYSPMYAFVDMVSWFTDSLNAMSRLIEVMDAEPDVKEPENPKSLGDVRGDVEFRHVDFSYDKNRKIIDDVSFSIEAGHALGIVGHTGAGKSTLANLLIRLYDVTAGEILIDGINVKDISFAELRKNVAIVSQETYLFMGTILDNIRYARPDATYEEVIEAAKIAGAHDFIIKLPDGYATMIGFGYKDLSGGERQRLSIARSILRDPKILILDEATAAMDTETERKIQTAIERLSKGRTTITIAHRLSTLRDADKLIVIENGKVPEAGTHLELINKKGIYYNLYKLQMDAMKNIGIEGGN